MNSQPLISIIIPVSPDKKEPEVLKSLRDLSYSKEKIEILLSEGCCPPRQRNLAAQQARGEVLVFFDDDVRVPPHYVQEMLRCYETWKSDGVGGPCLPLSGESLQGKTVQFILQSRWGTGPLRARYQSCPPTHRATDRHLILCNLSLVRDTFLEVGGFEEGLFPNEENELIDRYLQRGHRLAYSPSLATQRPVDTNLLNHWQRMWRYGQGRARQWKRRPSWYGSQHFFFLAILPLCFFLFLGFSQAWFLAKAIAFAYAVWLIAAGCDGLRRYRKLLFFFFAGIGIAGTHAAYTLGYWSGLLGRNCLPDGYFQGVVVNRFHA